MADSGAITSAQGKDLIQQVLKAQPLLPVDVNFESHEWGRLYYGNHDGLWEAGVIENGQRLPSGPETWRFVRSPDGRKLEIQRSQNGLWQVRWPYLKGESTWIPANQKRLAHMADWAAGIASLLMGASTEIRSKSMLRDWTTGDSTKLARAIEDLEYAKIDIAALMKKIRETMAKGRKESDDREDGDDDQDDDDDHDKHPVSPSGPPPSTVRT